MTESNNSIETLDIPEDLLLKWQELIDVAAKTIGVPAALIMRITAPDIEVFVSSATENNPYRPGMKEILIGSGLYCETVIKQKGMLLVPNALADPDWKDNPDVKLNMISYLGFPLLLPSGDPFGTICVLDSKENAHSDLSMKLLESFREMIEGHLELLYMNHVLGEEAKRLSDYISEIQTLRGILPICSFCKKIRDDDSRWLPVETYIAARSETDFSHTVCPECLEIHYPDIYPDL